MRLRRFPLIGGLLLAVVTLALGPGAWATHVTPVVFGDTDGEENNPSCAFLNPSWNELKVNQAPNGTYNDLGGGDNPGGPGPLTFTVSNSDGKTFNWTSNITIDALVVKGGDRGSNVYFFTPEASSDTGAQTPLNRQGALPAVSHISACYDVDSPAPATVEGTKFEDLDGNGARDNGEPGVQGWTIFVDLDGNGALDGGEPSATTGQDGSYEITNIPNGDHEIREIAQGGWICTTPDPCAYAESFAAGDTKTGKDFGNFELASVSGTKFGDSDGDGARDTGENGLGGWTIFVDLDGDGALDDGEPSAVTGQNGAYEIAGIGPGSFSVREVAQPDWTCTAPAGCAYSETFASGDAKTARDFGNQADQAGTQVPNNEGGDPNPDQGGGEQRQVNDRPQDDGGQPEGEQPQDNQRPEDNTGGDQQPAEDGQPEGNAEQPQEDGGQDDGSQRPRSDGQESEPGERTPQDEAEPESDSGEGDVLGESESDDGIAEEDGGDEDSDGDEDEEDDDRDEHPFTGASTIFLLMIGLLLLLTGLTGRRASSR